MLYYILEFWNNKGACVLMHWPIQSFEIAERKGNIKCVK